ncbi:Hep/Hag repeat protein, partial [Neisseria mucosa ATCC 25996]
MNKIFKVVWNRTIGSFVVTSELAKGRVKSSSEGAEGDVRASEEGRLKTLFRLTALSAALLGFSEGAWAVVAPAGQVANGTGGETAVNGGDARGTGAVAVGAYARAGTRGNPPHGMNSGTVAIGGSNATTAALADGNNAIAIGTNSNSNGAKATTIGSDTIASDQFATALGGRAEAKERGATAIGGWSQATGQFAVAIGGSDRFGRDTNTELNDGSGATLASGARSTAIGRRAKASGNDTLAFGTNAEATGVEAVAIGKGAASTAAKALALGQGARAQAGNTVAFGTGAQATQDGSIAIGTNTIATGVYKDTSRKGKAIAIGYNTNALGESSIAIGADDSAYGALTASSRQGIAIGTGAKATGETQSIAIGPDAISSGTQSTSIGNNTRATGDSSIAIGGDDWNIVRTKQVAAAGNKLVHQVFQDLTGMPMKQQGEAYGNPFKGTTAGDAAVAIGVAALAEGALSTAFGSGTSASGVGAAAFGVGATASQNKSVAIGAGSHTNTNATAVTEATVNGVTYRGFAGTEHITTGSQVSFGSAGYERQLKHVAPGAITATSTDAVNGSQLYALHVGAGNIAKSVADALGGGATVGNDPTHNQGSFVTLPSYDVLKGSDTPNTVGNGAVKFNTTSKNVADALTNLNTYVNQGFSVKDNEGTAKGIVTPGESVQFADGNATTVTVDTEANGNTKVKYDVQVDGETVKIKNGKLTAASQTHFYSVKNEDQTKGNYNNDGATGDNALAAGVDASATANGTTAVGLKAQASAESAIAVGSETKAAAKNAVVIGNKASVEAATGSVASVNGTTTGEGSVAVGAASKASGTNATAVGQAANAFGQNSFAGGQNSKASGKSSVAIGDGANATDDSSSAVGPYAQATKSGASAFGYYANALGENSLAAGRNAQATNANAVALGNESKATGQNTIAFGNNANASQNQAMALGRNTVASAGYTVALGDEAKATATKAIAFGSGAQATGANSVATGVQAKTHADDALAVGSNANASGESAIALGKQSNAWKVNSLAFGNSANSNGERAIAIGLESVSNGQNAVSVGQKAYADEHGVAIGSESNAAQAAAIAIGNKAQAMKYSSIVIGEEAKSNNSRSVVIGYHASATNPAMSASNQDTNQTVAIGAYANAWGDQSTAIGNNVDAKGNSSIAIGADDWDTVAVKTVAGTGKTVKQVYQDYTGDVMETGDDTYTHTTSGEAAVAIGTKSQAEGELSTAFGTGTRAQGVASAAFGMGAKATKGNSVAIGAGSTTATDATSVNEATVNNLKYSGFAGGNNVNPGDQVSFGSAGYERQLKNVAPGKISNTSTDAINGSQLYAVQNVLGNTAQTVKNVLGGDAAVDENGSITMSNIGNTGAGNIHDAINSVKETAEKGWKLKVNEEAGSEKIAPDDTVTVKQGKNIRVKRSSKDLTIETEDNVAFNKVTVGDSVLGSNGLNITNGANPVSLTKDGLNNGGNKVTKIADGEADTDAASYKQVKAAKTEVQKGTNVAEVKKTEGTDGQAIYTVNAKGTVVSAPGADNGLTLGSSEDTTTNVTTYNLDLSDKTKESLKKADSALQNIGVQVNGTAAKTLTKDDSTLNFVNGTGTTAENKGGTVTFNVNKSTLTTSAGGVVSADTAGDVFATATDVANAINKAVVDSEKTSIVAAGDNTHVASQVTGNQTLYTVHADKTTVSVKADGKLALNPAEATNSNQTKTTNYELDLSDDAKAEIQKGVDAKTAVDSKGIAFAGTNGTTDAAKLGETINLKGDDKNVETEAGTDGIKVKLKDEITLTSVTANTLKAGDSVLTNDGLNIAKGTAGSPVSLTKSGLNNGGNKITKVAKGENEDDAVNYAQLKELADKGLTFDADGNTSTSSKKLGERVGIKGGSNITTSADSDNVTVKLNDDITLTSVTATTLKAGDSTLTNAGLVTPKVTAGNSVLTTDGLTIANGANPVSLTKSGLNNGGNKITKVAKGAADTDAVNVSQLNPVAKALNTSIDPATGEVAEPNFTVNHADGTAGTPVHTVQDALNEVGKELNKGLNIAADKGTTDKVNLGETVTYTSKDKNIVTTVGSNEIDFSLADKITVGKAGQNPVVIDGTNGTVSGLTNKTLGGTDFATSDKAATEAQLDATQANLKTILGGKAANNNGNVTTSNIGETGADNVHDAIKSVKETAEKGWKLKVNEETSSEKINPDDEVAIKEGKNIKVTRNGKNITVATAEEVVFNKVTVGNSELTSAGLTTPKVTAGNSVLTTDGLTIANGANPVSLTKSGLNNGGNKITKVAKGAADTDAVNVSQLNPVAKALNTSIDPATGEVAEPNFTVNHADGTAGTPVHTVQDALNEVGKELNKGLNIAADKGTTDKVNLGETVTYTSKDKNIVTTVGSNEIDFSLADKITVGKAGQNPVVIDGTNGTVSGLTNKTLGGTDFATSDKAATEAQLDATQANLKTILGGKAANNNGNVTTSNIGETGADNVHDAIKSVKETAEKGWKLKVNEETSSEKINPDDEVAIKEGKNIKVTRNGKNITVATAEEVVFNKVTVGNSELTSA